MCTCSVTVDCPASDPCRVWSLRGVPCDQKSSMHLEGLAVVIAIQAEMDTSHTRSDSHASVAKILQPKPNPVLEPKPKPKSQTPLMSSSRPIALKFKSVCSNPLQAKSQSNVGSTAVLATPHSVPKPKVSCSKPLQAGVLRTNPRPTSLSQIHPSQNTSPNSIFTLPYQSDVATHANDTSRCIESRAFTVCSLCMRPFSPMKDIYMYRGDQAFCTEQCRRHQMLVDELKNK